MVDILNVPELDIAVRDFEIERLEARIAELEVIAQFAGEDNARAEKYAARIATLEAALKKLDAAFALMLLDCVDEDYIENFPNEYAEYISAAKKARAAMGETE